MNYWQTLLNAEVIVAMILAAGTLPPITLVAANIEQKLQPVPISHELWTYLGHPALLALPALLFTRISYPSQYGISEAINFSKLMDLNQKSYNSLINWLFLVAIVLPNLPILRGQRGPVAALQTMVISAVVFTWIACTKSGISQLSIVPDFPSVFAWTLGSVVLFKVAGILSFVIGNFLDQRWHLEGVQDVLKPALAFVLQGPIILAYTVFLGNQLPSMGADQF